MVNTKENFIKSIIASILSGALLFFMTPCTSQDTASVAPVHEGIEKALLVTNDSSVSDAKPLDTTFVEIDTTQQASKTDTMKFKKYRSPMIAGLYSAIIPGLGQAYNHKYWKIPFIYAGGGVLVYYSIRLNNRYTDFLNRYNNEYFKPTNLQNSDSIEFYSINRDHFGKLRNKFILFTGLLYAANIVDAIVDAYFSEFDITDDLSLKIKPAITYPDYAMGKVSYGVSLKFNF